MKKLFIANWKMNVTQTEAKAFMKDFKKKVAKQKDVDIVICPTYTTLETMKKLTKHTNINIAAQNMYCENSGAYTGEISPIMLKEIGIDCVMLGHSERRIYFKETDEDINNKVLKAIENGLRVILCIGENIKEREAGETEKVIKNQLTKALKGVEDLSSIYVAYEPVWSISTFSKGRTATIDEIVEVHKQIRKQLTKMYKEQGKTAYILYGGSVNEKNSTQIMQLENVDGALVGGASLTAEKFYNTINYNK